MKWQVAAVSYGNLWSMRVLGNKHGQTGVCKKEKKIDRIWCGCRLGNVWWNLASDEQVHKPSSRGALPRVSGCALPKIVTECEAKFPWSFSGAFKSSLSSTGEKHAVAKRGSQVTAIRAASVTPEQLMRHRGEVPHTATSQVSEKWHLQITDDILIQRKWKFNKFFRKRLWVIFVQNQKKQKSLRKEREFTGRAN